MTEKQAFITNSNTKILRKRLLELIKTGDELKFLVGFFYFSGIRELYAGLKANPNVILKILVGLNVDRLNLELIEYADNDKSSDEEKIYKYFQSIKKSLNTKYLDNKVFYEQIKLFIQLIKDNRLIIRKSLHPNHAKLYIFKLNETQIGKKDFFITGSSNLTGAGVATQNEFNVEIGDFGFDEASKYFDERWLDAVKITEASDIKEKFIKLLEKETLIRLVSPFEAFCLALKTYLDSFEQKDISDALIKKILADRGYKPYRYQIDAIKQALSIMEKFNGAIIADVVGLGKTIIAAVIAKLNKKRGIVICPPGLIGGKNKKSGWRMYLEEFNLYDWEVWSRGDLKNALSFVGKAKDIDVVIIDEAHWFRNQDTENYHLLKNICRHKQVILLTATPFNNRPSDILSLLKLFIPTKQSTITLDKNLDAQFKSFKYLFYRLGYIKKHGHSPDINKRKRALKFYKDIFHESNIDLKKIADKTHYLARRIRDVIEPVTIRRNRLDLNNNPYYKDEVKDLSKVADPLEWFYKLSLEQSQFYDEIITEYFGSPDNGGRFKGAIYRPFEYEKGYIRLDDIESEETLNQTDNRQFMQQRNLFNFMRRLLVKRFESSFGSFKQSIKNFKRITENSRDFINKTGEYILDRKLLEKIYESDVDEIETYLYEYEEKINKGEYPKNHKRYKLAAFKLKQQFLDDIENDLKLFDEILIKLSKLELVKNDPKTACLIDHLNEEFAKVPQKGEPKRKIIIFSEYIDTVKYLKVSLGKHYGDRLLVVDSNLSAAKITAINQNFDASLKEQANDYDLLLTTDKISEGFNLNRAGMVINYDIPWNPVRVIQRLGRINRISKKVFSELYIVNFFPTEKGAALVNSREIAANKMYLIHSTLGEDAKIFNPDEEPTPSGLFNRVQQNPDKQEAESTYTKALNKLLSIKKSNPELIAGLNDFPPRVKVAKKYNKNELLVFFKKGRLYIIGAKTDMDKTEPYNIIFDDVYDKIACEPETEGLDWNTEKFWQTYEDIQNFREYRLGQVIEASLEQRALNNLNTLIKSAKPELMPCKSFLRTLREDILSYGTLADYTLRRVIKLKEDTVKDIDLLKDELGEDYLAKEKERLKDQEKEIIIAIENKKS